MCRQCLRAVRPDRGSSCLDSGAYIANYSGCGKCGKRGLPKEAAREREYFEDERETSEEVTFQHTCAECEHVICEHYYTFKVRHGESQEYFMDCFLCGNATHFVDLSVFEVGGEAVAEVVENSASASASAPAPASTPAEQRVVKALKMTALVSQLAQAADEGADEDSEDAWSD